MPQVIFASAAMQDLQRLRDFLRSKNADTARRAGEAIGRIVDDLPEQFREWIIDFGDSGYVARYRIDNDVVTILAVRHQKEAGYFKGDT